VYLASDPDGSGPWLYSLDVERRIPHRLSSGVERYTSVAASADGRHLVATLANAKRTLWRLPLSDSPARDSAASRILLTTGTGFSPRLGPGYLLYVSATAARESIWKVSGGGATELWSAPGARILGGPAISADGQQIAFSVGSGGKTSLYVMRADGSDVRALTGPPSISNGASLEASVRRVSPPTIMSLTATPDVLWPANHKMVPVSLKVGVSDNSDPQPECRITGVTSNETIARTDWQMTGSLTGELLAERSGGGRGRIYTLTVTCTNSSELSSTATVNISVPHDQRK